MAGMRFDVASHRFVALQAHLVSVGAKLQRGGVSPAVSRMRIVAVPALCLTLAEALRAHEGLHDEGGFAKAPVLVERVAGVLLIRPLQALAEELDLSARVVDFAHAAGLHDTGLHVALSAHRDVCAVVHILEAQGWLVGGSRRVVTLLHPGHVRLGRPVAHLAIHAGLPESHALGSDDRSFRLYLARVT